MDENIKRAKDFLNKVGAKMTITFKGKEDSPIFDDGALRNRYRVTITRNGSRMGVTFTQSLRGTEDGDVPTEYDILACLTQYAPPTTVEDFAAELGFDYEYEGDAQWKKADKTLKAVQREWEGVQRVFGDCLDELREIY